MNPGRSKSRWSEMRPKKIANVFSALQILLFREENSRQNRSLHSHSSFCEEVFSRSEPDWRIPESVYSERGPRSQNLDPASRWRMRRTGSNILAPGLRSESYFSDSPFSRLHR